MTLSETFVSAEEFAYLKGMEITNIQDCKDSEGNEGVMIDFVGKTGEKVTFSIMDNIEHGLSLSRSAPRYPVYCEQDLKDYEGYTITSVRDDGSECRVELTDRSNRRAALLIDGVLFDGSMLQTERWTDVREPEIRENDAPTA